jgi:hypothetical protein
MRVQKQRVAQLLPSVNQLDSSFFIGEVYGNDMRSERPMEFIVNTGDLEG